MSTDYRRESIGEGIALTRIVDKKFKANAIRIRFITPVCEDEAGLNALLVSLLLTSNSEITSRSKLSAKFMELYGTSVGAAWSNVGDYQSVGFSLCPIMDRYTIGGEVISKEAVRQLLLCIFSPDIKDGHFNEKYFELRKQELLDNIAAAVNDKFSYAYSLAKKVIYENEPASFSELGTAERAKSITQEELIAQYHKLLETAQIEITVCGGGEIDEAVDMIKEAFCKTERKDTAEITYRRFSPLKAEIKETCTEMDVAQCKLFMAYKSDCKDIYTCKLFAAMLGGTAFSKLFMNVREKLSLCYSCDSAYLDLKGTLIIHSGVARENIPKLREAAHAQLVAMQEGDFTDELLENSKLYICGGFKSNYDSEWDIAAWYSVQNMRGTCYTPEEVEKIIHAITREDIINCARSFKPDSVFILKAKEGSADE